MNDTIDHKIKTKNTKLNKKFSNLVKNRIQKPVILSEKHKTLLNNGINHCFKREIPLLDIVADIEVGLKCVKNISAKNKDEIRKKVKGHLMKQKEKTVCPFDKKILRDLNELKRMNDIVYTKADKNNAIVILDAKDYDDRMIDLINSGNYRKCDRKENILKKMCDDVLSETKNTATSLNENKFQYIFKVSNPRIPLLHGLPKTHKAGKKMRPIASNIRAPTSRISKWLLNEFRKLKPPPGYSVKNSIDFVNRVKDVTLKRNEKLISFDVESLYPSIPKKKAMEYLERWLIMENVDAKMIEIYTNLTKLCIDQSFFSYRGDVYQQMDGVAMGNPISSFIADLFMCFFEKEISTSHLFPRIWFRYVDDVFCIINARKSNNILSFINTQNESINFTKEEMNTNGELPFLDLLIRVKEDGKLSFKVYRKPTATDRFITSESNHCGQHKKSAFHSMIYRLLHIPMCVNDFNNELENIYKIASVNGYNKVWIDKILFHQKSKKEAKELTTHRVETQTVQRMAVTYHPNVSYNIATILKKHNIYPVNKSSNKLLFCLQNTKDVTELMDKSGVYSISCSGENCDKEYIGRTKRKLHIRFKEHQYWTTKNNTMKSSVAAHMIEHNHSFDVDDMKIVRECYDEQRLKILESIHIQKHIGNNLMNSDDGEVSSILFQVI